MLTSDTSLSLPVPTVLEKAADKDLKFASRGQLVWKGVSLRPLTASLASLGIKTNDVLHFLSKTSKFKLQVPSLDGAEAFEVTRECYHSQRLLDVKTHLLQSLLLCKHLDSQSYHLTCRGHRLLEALSCGQLDEESCGLLQLEDALTHVLLHLKAENGSFFDLKVSPSTTKVKDRKYLTSV